MTTSRSSSLLRRVGSGNGVCGARRAVQRAFSARARLFGGRGLRVAAYPTFEIRKGALAQRGLAREILGGTAAELAAFRIESRRRRKRREEPEIYVHRLKRRRACVDGLNVSASYVRKQGTMSGRRRRRLQWCAQSFGGCKTSSQQPDRGGFDIAFATGDLSGEPQARLDSEPQRAVEQLRRIEKCVAMQAAESCELCSFEAGNRAENAYLLAVFQLGLESDHVEQRAEFVVLAKLHDRVRLHVRPMRIGQPERLHRPVPQRLRAALRHHLDWQATVEIGRRGFPLVERGFLSRDQGFDEGVILLAAERTVDVVRAGAAGPGLVVARLKPGGVEIDRLAMNDWGDRVKKSERFLAAQFSHRGGEIGRCERAGRDNDAVPFGGRDCHFLARDGDQRMRGERAGHRG